MKDAAYRRLQGLQDARSTRGIFSRGKNVYSAGVSAPNNQAYKKKKKNVQNIPQAAIRRRQGMGS